MDQKIAKIFSYFTDIKHQNIFSLCVLQLVEAYEDSPQALKPILYNLKTLFFSKTKEPRLKLKQRQLASSIIEKIILKQTLYLDSFLNRNNVQDMENFHIEEGETELVKSQSQSYEGSKWSQIPFAQIIETKPLLLLSEQKYKETEEELRRIENEFFAKLNSTETATATNVNIFLGDLAFLQEGETEGQEDVSQKLRKYEKKIQKLKKKEENSIPLKSQTITVFNPFNVIFEFGIENILSPYWQTRHLSVLLLKALVSSLRYVGFSFSIKIQNISKQQSFQVIYEACKKHLQHFIKNNNSSLLKRELVYQNILLLALDRFADYQAERSNIMVRSVGAQILSSLYHTLMDPEKSQFLAAIKSLLEHEASVNDPLGLFAWELRHSFVHLIFLIIQEPANQQPLFHIFHQTFLSLLDRIDQDEVILSVCECLSELSSSSFFTIAYAKQVNNRLWNIIENLDDVSFSATKIFLLLGGYLNLIEIDELDCLVRLKNFFTNRLDQVRQQFYKLETEIFSRKFKVSIKQNYRPTETPTVENIIPWISTQFLQEIMVEQCTQNLSSLVDLGSSLFPYLLADGEESMIAEFCSSVVCMFEPIQKIIDSEFVNKKDYKFICEEEKGDILNDHINIRIWKVSQIIGDMLVRRDNHLTENILDPFISLGTSVDTRFLLITLGIISVGFKNRPQVAAECKFLVEFIEKVLKLEENDITTGVIDMYQSQLQANLQQYLPQITDSDQISLCHQNLGSKSWDLRSKLHTLLLERYNTNPSPPLHLIISLIETIVEIQKELMKNIKILASYCYCCLLPDQQPKPLNLIIKSIQECMKQQKYYFITQIATSCMFKLAQILYKKNKSVYLKFNTNTLNHVATKYQLKKTGIHRKKGHFRIDAERMEALGEYIPKIIAVDSDWLNTFENSFLKGFQQEEFLKSSLSLIEGTIEHLVNICNQDFMTKMLGHLETLLPNQQHSPQLNSIIKKTLLMTVAHWRPESNIFLEWFLRLFGTSLLVIRIMKESLEDNIVKLSPICCLFLLDSMKLMTGGGDQREPAMGCLSNLFMGAFISTKKPQFSASLQQIAEKGLLFVRDFKNISNFDYKISIKQKLELRSYQHEGVKWMGFLVKYHLNGALCDDMGLGKTLQTLTVIENEYSRLKEKDRNRVSLVVAPSTLVEHWSYEYSKYFSESGCMRPCCIFQRNDQALMDLKDNNLKCNLIITSYSVIEKSVEVFQKIKFKFIILDEGHLVKNTRTNKFKALMQLKSDHKFILSGTPVQNKLLELWGIFQFLMPGYLGSETEFKTKYNKLFNVNLMTFKEDDLLFNKEQKQALESLHIKVMPFILRRLKKEVLKELPDKIIQDYLCQMTDVQKKLYSKFSKSQQDNKFDAEEVENQDNGPLSALNQMRKIVNHPNLVGNSYDYRASGKFLALKDLLDDLGFQYPESLTNKVIIFSRFNGTLDLIESLLLNSHYKGIRFSKLVGTVPQNKRFSVAQEFNDSFDIKVLLTTTAIGGYGLNLTAANIVIMFDHDYNPSVDMQAIDRAHRLGQKNVLNVYRLIMKDTLEQKIMGIQRFKTNLAFAIVNLDNASIKNVENSKLPELLQRVSLIQESEKKRVNKSLYKSMMEELEKDAIDAEDYHVQY